MAAAMRNYLGDTDEQLVAHLTPKPLPADADPRTFRASNYMPDQIEKRWNDYLERFTTHYGLREDQRLVAEAKLQQQKENYVRWLSNRPADGGKPELLKVKRSYPSGAVDLSIPVPEQVERFRNTVAELRNMKGPKLLLFGKDVEKARRASVTAELVAMRTEFAMAIAKKTDEMKQALEDTLPHEPLPEAKKDATKSDATKKDVAPAKPKLVKDYLDKGPVAEPTSAETKPIAMVDRVTRWALLLIGASLLLGLFTRLGCVGGGLFLLMTLLTVPPLPWLPTPPNVEGHSFFVNKNMIEMLALFALAFIPTGRWFGLDGLVHALNPFAESKKQVRK
jgi:uncharacterized membrane protein YphA (DoxX/SURF4 family)